MCLCLCEREKEYDKENESERKRAATEQGDNTLPFTIAPLDLLLLSVSLYMLL